MRLPEEPRIRLELANYLDQVRPVNRVQLPRFMADQIRGRAVMGDHDGSARMGPVQPIVEPVPMIFMNADRLERSDLPIPRPGVPDVAIAIHSLAGDPLGPVSIRAQSEVRP